MQKCNAYHGVLGAEEVDAECTNKGTGHVEAAAQNRSGSSRGQNIKSVLDHTGPAKNDGERSAAVGDARKSQR